MAQVMSFPPPAADAVAVSVPAPPPPSQSKIGEVPIMRDIVALPRHLKRFFGGPKSKDDAWRGEAKLLERATERTQLYGLWRRSGIICGILASYGVLVFATWTLVNRIKQINDYQKELDNFSELVREDIKFFSPGGSFEQHITSSGLRGAAANTFKELGHSVATVLQGIINEYANLVTTRKIMFGMECAQYAVAVFAVFSVHIAAWHWKDFRRSSKWMAIAWVSAFVVPFLFAVIPFRNFLSTSDIWGTTNTMMTSTFRWTDGCAVSAAMSVDHLTRWLPLQRCRAVGFGCGQDARGPRNIGDRCSARAVRITNSRFPVMLAVRFLRST